MRKLAADSLKWAGYFLTAALFGYFIGVGAGHGFARSERVIVVNFPSEQDGGE